MSDDKYNKGDDNGKLLYCSFCGKSQHEVRKLIAGPSVFVCDECVDLCNDIIREEVQESQTESSQQKLPTPVMKWSQHLRVSISISPTEPRNAASPIP